jgi:uncharacterized membrane protein YqgA involved in biofilm formation
MGITGALINAGAILAGGSLGLLLKGRMTEKLSQGLMRALGLCVSIIGISGALRGDIILMVIAIAIGTISGELIGIDAALNRLGTWVQHRFSKNTEGSTFAQGFVASTLLFCVGAMAVVGSIDSGLMGDQTIIISKSIIDAVSAMALASTMGAGVLFSAIIVLLYQGSIEFFASYLQDVFTTTLIAQISAVGGVMILGIGINMVIAQESKIKVANLLPSFIFAVAYYYLFM